MNTVEESVTLWIFLMMMRSPDFLMMNSLEKDDKLCENKYSSRKVQNFLMITVVKNISPDLWVMLSAGEYALVCYDDILIMSDVE